MKAFVRKVFVRKTYINKDGLIPKVIRNLGVFVLVLSLLATSLTVIEAKTTQEYVEELQDLAELILDEYAGGDVTKQELFEAAMEGMFTVLDDYSEFYTEEEGKALLDSLAKEYVGIGVRLEYINEKIVITDVFEGGAAFDGGVQINDVIIEVNGEAVEGPELNPIVDKIIGEEGTMVKVTFQRGATVYELNLERRRIVVPTVVSIDLNENYSSVGSTTLNLIKAFTVDSFSEGTDEELINEARKAINSGAKYLLLDMRGNGGGYLETAVNIARELVPKGNIVTLVDSKGNETKYLSYLETPKLKIVLLVDGQSASATEIFASTIKDSGVGVIIGENTYGKGVAQNILTLSEEHLVKLTTAEFFSRNGNKINGIGIMPDIIVDMPEYVYSSRRFYSSDVDDQILNVEGILAFLGYFSQTPDNKYTYDTYLAVKAFQAATGLYSYGVCDFTTQAMLNTEYSIAKEKNDLQMKAALDWIKKDI